MCYSGCRYERSGGHPDFRGECTIGDKVPLDAHCYDEELDSEEEIDYEED